MKLSSIVYAFRDGESVSTPRPICGTTVISNMTVSFCFSLFYVVQARQKLLSF